MKSQNKIIFVINNYEFYLTHRFNLLKHLAKENDIHLITNTAGFKIDSKNIYHLDIGRKSMNIFKNLKTSLELSSLVKKIDPTHIFFISFKPIALGVIPSLFSKAKKYLIFSGLGYSFINNSFKARIARIAINIALRIFSILGSKFIFQNPDDKKLINKSGFIQEKNTQIIYGNGIDENDFRMRKVDNFRDKLKFIFVGRLLKDKGINELCTAIQSVGNKAEFTIISPDDKENIASIEGTTFENLKNMDSVELINKLSHEEIKNIYSKSDVFILPSYREGLPRSALEAMCAGLPLILSDVPGCRECLINGLNGFLIKSKSSESIEKAINKFIEKPEIIKKMGEESVNLIRKKFSDQKIFKNYEGIL